MKSELLRAIAKSWLIVATLDILAAFIQTWLYGRNPIKVLNYIASGVFGQSAIEGTWHYGLYGLIFHYFIALSWTTLFFLMYPRLKFLSKNLTLTGMGYGLFVWILMTQAVLPLSNVTRGPFRLTSAIIAIVILMVAIGLPLAFMAAKFYSRAEKP